MSKNGELYVYSQEGFQERLSLVIGDESFRSFSQKAGCSDTLLRKYMSGSVPSIEKAAQICSASDIKDEDNFIRYFGWLCLGLGEQPESISTGTTKRTISESAAAAPAITAAHDSDDVVWINSYDVFASAGNGFINNEYETGSKLPFSYAWLAENGLTGKHLSLIRVSGDSMYPTLRDKEIPLVEMLPDDFINRLVDDVYVIRMNGQLLVKRIQRYGNNGFLIKSDNQHYDSYPLTRENWPDDFKVIARWTGKKF